jgi:hypothetical protein
MKVQLSISAFCLVAFGGLLGLAPAFCGPANQTAAPISAANIDRDISVMENRFFSKLYDDNPIEKRLERLELLVFSGIQSGSNTERLDRLKKVVSTPVPLKAQSPQSGSAADQDNTVPKNAAANSKKDSSSTQYPILTTLEWKGLKKTYPTESLDQRLERLETKIFGLSSPAMAYFDRVERLRKAVGIDAEMPQQASRGLVGPKPKARPRGSSDYSDDFSVMPRANVPNAIPNENMPFAGVPSNPFGMLGQDPIFKQMADLMNLQMQQMQQMQSGAMQPGQPGITQHKMTITPGTQGGVFTFQFDGKNPPVQQFIPFGGEQGGIKALPKGGKQPMQQIMPQMPQSPFKMPNMPQISPFGKDGSEQKSPSYYDPNVI